ncbi:hypothetical protein LTR22_028312, partial [Elasticomyces elasticus]
HKRSESDDHPKTFCNRISWDRDMKRLMFNVCAENQTSQSSKDPVVVYKVIKVVGFDTPNTKCFERLVKKTLGWISLTSTSTSWRSERRSVTCTTPRMRLGRGTKQLRQRGGLETLSFTNILTTVTISAAMKRLTTR